MTKFLIFLLVVSVVAIFIFNSVKKAANKNIELFKTNWNKYKPVIEKFSGDLTRVYKYLEEEGLNQLQVSQLLGTLRQQKYIDIESNTVTILKPLPENF